MTRRLQCKDDWTRQLRANRNGNLTFFLQSYRGKLTASRHEQKKKKKKEKKRIRKRNYNDKVRVVLNLGESCTSSTSILGVMKHTDTMLNAITSPFSSSGIDQYTRIEKDEISPYSLLKHLRNDDWKEIDEKLNTKLSGRRQFQFDGVSRRTNRWKPNSHLIRLVKNAYSLSLVTEGQKLKRRKVELEIWPTALKHISSSLIYSAVPTRRRRVALIRRIDSNWVADWCVNETGHHTPWPFHSIALILLRLVSFPSSMISIIAFPEYSRWFPALFVSEIINGGLNAYLIHNDLDSLWICMRSFWNHPVFGAKFQNQRAINNY